MEISEAESIIEGLLYAAGDELSVDKISSILEVDKKTVKSILRNMELSYNQANRGIMMREINGSYQLCTKFEHYEYIRKLFEPRKKETLSQAAFEILSIIAYNQPVTKAKIENIRGVSSDSVILKLLERELIKETGRLDCPGKPILYATTNKFLRSFGISSVTELKGLEINNFDELAEDGTIINK